MLPMLRVPRSRLAQQLPEPDDVEKDVEVNMANKVLINPVHSINPLSTSDSRTAITSYTPYRSDGIGVFFDRASIPPSSRVHLVRADDAMSLMSRDVVIGPCH